MEKQRAAGEAAKGEEGYLGPFSMTALTLALVLTFTTFANAAMETAGAENNAAESDGAIAEGAAGGTAAVSTPAVGAALAVEPASVPVSAIMDQYPNGTLFSVTLRQGDVIAAIKKNGTKLTRVSSSGEAISSSIVPLWQIASLQPSSSAQPSGVFPSVEPAAPDGTPPNTTAPNPPPSGSSQPNPAQFHLTHLNQSLSSP